ncbi:uncharacterized protein LOC119107803 [Pollicipes pollicipes]|uniref:uncharacterized protein LOC119107803 n=1 Tax=Pollicipes pollicipes TaxID=41117 RepID=UPI001885463C|nr:uncharacterized protein LOC119107803 [Pollicipes pollicipes]
MSRRGGDTVWRCPTSKAIFCCLLVVAIVLVAALWLQYRGGQGMPGRPAGLPAEDGLQACDCVWRIGCPRFDWQVNLTTPGHTCGFENMTSSLVDECLAGRWRQRGRPLRLRLVGHVREAYLAEYVRRRLGATPVREGCRLDSAGPAAKGVDGVPELHNVVRPLDGSETCEMVYATDVIRLEYKLLGLLGDDIFSYIGRLKRECVEEGCDGDLLIISGGVAELLNSTLMESFSGVRRFQSHFKRLLPLLNELVTLHHLKVVWKIHEPVTDELIAEDSMVRNDLLQEYNALIMEQTVRSPVRAWTSHMLMKLRHIEECAPFADDSQVNSDEWRCEDQWVAGDRCHRRYFDAIFNRLCEKMVKMPENPCCSA